MKFRRLSWLILLVVLSMVLVACGGDDDGGDGDDSGDGDAASAIELGQAVESEEGLSFDIPEDWVFEAEFGQVTIASSEDVMATMDTDATSLGEGNAAAVVALLPADTLEILELAADASPADVLNAFAGNEGAPEIGDIEEFEAGGNAAAIAAGSQSIDEVTIDSTQVAVSLNGAFALFNFVADEGQLEGFDSIIRAIVGSAEYTAPSGGENTEEAEG